MKKKLSTKQTILVASTLFGMFFGAGNLIFPVHLGQMAGSNVWPATIGFIKDIEIYGVNALNTDEILSKMFLQKGSAYKRNLVQSDLKQIYEN